MQGIFLVYRKCMTFSVSFFEQKNDKEKRDEILRRLFNNKMSEIWNSEDEAELEKMKAEKIKRN